jgi:hypothetical protein
MSAKGFDEYFEVLWPSPEVLKEPEMWGSTKTVSRYKKLVRGPNKLTCDWCRTNIHIGCILIVNRSGGLNADGEPYDRRDGVKCRDCLAEHLKTQNYFETPDVISTFAAHPCEEGKLCFPLHLTAEFRGNS